MDRESHRGLGSARKGASSGPKMFVEGVAVAQQISSFKKSCNNIRHNPIVYQRNISFLNMKVTVCDLL